VDSPLVVDSPVVVGSPGEVVVGVRTGADRIEVGRPTAAEPQRQP
jgi:hypothetical protein